MNRWKCTITTPLGAPVGDPLFVHATSAEVAQLQAARSVGCPVDCVAVEPEVYDQRRLERLALAAVALHAIVSDAKDFGLDHTDSLSRLKAVDYAVGYADALLERVGE